MIEKGFTQYDPAMARAIRTVDLDDYTPIETPSGASGFIWKQLWQIRRALPGIFWGLYLRDKAMDEYVEYVNELLIRYSEENDKECTADFEDLVMSSLSDWLDIINFCIIDF